MKFKKYIKMRRKNLLVALSLAAATSAVAQGQWSREVYRELDLRDYANQGLYSPRTAEGGNRGLFAPLMERALEGGVTLYAYAVSGNETFTPEGTVDVRDVLDAYDIPFTVRDGKVLVKGSDMPSQEVTRYYIRERRYFDGTDSSFRSEVVAICPVLERGDGLSEGLTRYPMFWVICSDVRDLLEDTPVVTDYRNTGRAMSAADYFALGRYKGSIYRERNAMGLPLSHGDPSDSAYAAEQRRVEKELVTVREKTYDTYYTDAQAEPEPQYRRFLFFKIKKKATKAQYDAQAVKAQASDTGVKEDTAVKAEETADGGEEPAKAGEKRERKGFSLFKRRNR